MKFWHDPNDRLELEGEYCMVVVKEAAAVCMYSYLV